MKEVKATKAASGYSGQLSSPEVLRSDVRLRLSSIRNESPRTVIRP